MEFFSPAAVMSSGPMRSKMCLTSPRVHSVRISRKSPLAMRTAKSKPRIENKHESRDTPLGLIRANFIEVIGLPEKRGQEGKHQARCGQQRHSHAGKPEPPLTAR